MVKIWLFVYIFVGLLYGNRTQPAAVSLQSYVIGHQHAVTSLLSHPLMPPVFGHLPSVIGLLSSAIIQQSPQFAVAGLQSYAGLHSSVACHRSAVNHPV